MDEHKWMSHATNDSCRADCINEEAEGKGGLGWGGGGGGWMRHGVTILIHSWLELLQLALDTEKDKLHTQKQAFDAKCETKDLTILDFQKQLADRDR